MSTTSSAMSLVTLLLLTLSQTTSASLSLPSLQPIQGFSTDCTNTYSSPINSCPDANTFLTASQSQAVCTQSCFIALKHAVFAIQNACQYQSANGDTVIGHAFKGDLAVWLCGSSGTDDGAGNGGAASTLTATNAMPSASSPAATSSVDPANSATSSSDSEPTTIESLSSTSDSAFPQTSLTSSASLPAIATTTSATSGVSNSTTLLSSSSGRASSTLSASSSRVSASSSATAKSSTSSAAKPTNSIDSTPFDQTASGTRSLPGFGVSALSFQIMIYLCSLLLLSSI